MSKPRIVIEVREEEPNVILQGLCPDEVLVIHHGKLKKSINKWFKEHQHLITVPKDRYVANNLREAIQFDIRNELIAGKIKHEHEWLRRYFLESVSLSEDTPNSMTGRLLG